MRNVAPVNSEIPTLIPKSLEYIHIGLSELSERKIRKIDWGEDVHSCEMSTDNSNKRRKTTGPDLQRLQDDVRRLRAEDGANAPTAWGKTIPDFQRLEPQKIRSDSRSTTPTLRGGTSTASGADTAANDAATERRHEHISWTIPNTGDRVQAELDLLETGSGYSEDTGSQPHAIDLSSAAAVADLVDGNVRGCYKKSCHVGPIAPSVVTGSLAAEGEKNPYVEVKVDILIGDRVEPLFLPPDTQSDINVLSLKTVITLGKVLADLDPCGGQERVRGLSFEDCPLLGMIHLTFSTPEEKCRGPYSEWFFVVPNAAFPRHEGVLGWKFCNKARIVKRLIEKDHA